MGLFNLLQSSIKLLFLITDEGKEAVSIYNHKGYTRASTEDYDSERAAQKMMMSMN